jgi:hypothetical protein
LARSAAKSPPASDIERDVLHQLDIVQNVFSGVGEELLVQPHDTDYPEQLAAMALFFRGDARRLAVEFPGFAAAD